MTVGHGHGGLIGRIVRAFADSKLTPLIILLSLVLGAMAVARLPREEEPQISVPIFDIFVEFPGASAEEVERRIVQLGERKLWEIPGVEYLYATARPHQALFIVRFRVGEDPANAAIKLYTKVFANLDFLPSGATQPLIKQRSIDDVPVLALTFHWSSQEAEHSPSRDPMALRQAVARLRQAINAISDVSETTIIGGRRRQFLIFFDHERLKERLLQPLDLVQLVQRANIRFPAHHVATDGPSTAVVEADAFVTSVEDLERLVVGVSQGAPVYLRDVARIVDGPDEEERAVTVRFGPGAHDGASGPFEAVTLAVSKRQGANAAALCETILRHVELLRGTLLPEDVVMTVTRNYGETATEKSNELLLHMAIAVIGVTLLIALVLGRWESGVVAVAIPMTLALTLATFYFLGFTLNRITLFALIFSIGILVDDPIVDVENIVRHLRMPANRGRSLLDVTIEAVNEVRSPLILATLTVIAAILPMAFVRGLMGPYMRPIPIGASAAMLFSMIVAFVATPWTAHRVLGWAFRRGRLKGHGVGEGEDRLTRLYRSYMAPLIYRPRVRAAFLWALAALLVGSVLLVPLGWVRLKMLPFDNKNEFQVVLNMPEGTPLERTQAVVEVIAQTLRQVPEVADIETYVGASAPYNFNGLVRHYFLRAQPHQAELQVNLVSKHHRRRQSHAIAESVRPAVHEIVARAGGHVQVAEVPPGPPVLSTLVVEVYGPTREGQTELARRIETLLAAAPGVTDVDTYVEAERPRLRLAVDRPKASLNGIEVAAVAQTIAAALAGRVVDLAHVPDAPEPVEMLLRLPQPARQSIEATQQIHLLSRFGRTIPIGELTTPSPGEEDRAIHHKNLIPVSYVIADVTGSVASPVYAILRLRREIARLEPPPDPSRPPAPIRQYFTRQPESSQAWSIKWDGEWHITYEVFRDLGLAFAAVLLLIYALVVGWFRSFKTPWIVMLPIPLSLVGILPAHWAGGVFFTATSMIGLIAGAGIVVRNAIILVDFIQLRLAQGLPLEEAVIDAGATRFRPMLLTAAAVVVGSSVILFDPIFQGLAIALMAGEIASTILSRTAVPVIYYLMMRDRREKASVEKRS